MSPTGNLKCRLIQVRRILTVSATPEKVSILDGINIIADHMRSYDKCQQIEQESHIKALVAEKKQARLHRGQDRLIKAVPSCSALLIKAAEHGYHLGSIVSNLLRLLGRYSTAELEAAVNEALRRGVPHLNAVRFSLEKHRHENNQLPPVHINLPNDKRVRELTVRTHDLRCYDILQLSTEKENDEI